MSLRYGSLCLLLCLIVLLLAIKNYELWTQPVEGLLEPGRTRRGETRTEGLAAVGGPKEKVPLSSYILVSEKNIFSPERKEFSVAILEQPKLVARPQIVLYGVTIKQDYQSATITSPGRLIRKGDREMITIKIGDRVGDYKLAKISPDRITMEGAEDSYEVLLYDSSLPKRRTATRTESKPAQVTTTAPAPAPTPAPAAVPRAAEAPRPAEPPRETVAEPPLPRPVTPPQPTYPGSLRGRRPIRPNIPPETEGK
jgi:hypothetical protein